MDPSKHAPLRISDIRSKYQVIDKVGKGTYGTVYKVLNLHDNKFYAIKKFENTEAKLQVQGFPITALREISLLKQLNHPNVINLKEIICSKPNKRNLFRGSTFMVFEYMHHDFSGLFRSKIKFSQPQIKCIMKQILEGCQFLHQNKIMHRDIKSANILLNDQGNVQLADFGLGRRTRFDNVYTYKVVTLWYRAPELLLGCKTYNHKVDVWSIGCVFAQFLTNQVLFKKQTQYALMQRIYEICGDLQENEYMQEYLRGCVYFNDMRPKKSFKNILEAHIKKLNPNVDQLSLKFLKGLLELNPYKRLSCEQALNHQYFKQQPLPCTPQQIHKLDVQYHEMFRDRSLKIERKKQHRKQSVDWSQEEQKKKKQKHTQKTQENSYSKQPNRYQRKYPDRSYQRRPYERPGEKKYDSSRKDYASYEKYQNVKKKKYSKSKSQSSSSSSSSRSRSRNKKHGNKYSEERSRKHKVPSYSKYNNDRDYSSRKDSQKAYKEKSYERSHNYERQKGYTKAYDARNNNYKKQYPEETHLHKIYDNRSRQNSGKYDQADKYSGKQYSTYRQHRQGQRPPRDQKDKSYGRGEQRQRYPDPVKNNTHHGGNLYENGDKQPTKDSYQKYDNSYTARQDRTYQSRQDKPRQDRSYPKQSREFPKKEYYPSSQKYNEERRPFGKQKQRQSSINNSRKQYHSKDYGSRKISVENRSSQQKRRHSPQKRKISPQRRKISPQRRKLSPQTRKTSPFKRPMDVQEY